MRRRDGPPLERDDAGAAPGSARRRGGGVRGLTEPLLRQVGGVREAGRLAAHDPDPGTAVASRHQLLDAAVVEPGARRAPILDEDLGEVTASTQGCREGPLEYVGFDHVTFLPPSTAPLFPACPSGRPTGLSQTGRAR